MAVTVVATLKLKPGLADTVLGGLKELLPDTRAYAGCQSVEVGQDQDNADTLVLVERWNARSDHEAYVAWRTETGTMDSMADVLTEAPVFMYLNDTGI